MGSGYSTIQLKNIKQVNNTWFVIYTLPDENKLGYIQINDLITYWNSTYFSKFGEIPNSTNSAKSTLIFSESDTIQILREAFLKFGLSNDTPNIPYLTLSSTNPPPLQLYGVTIIFYLLCRHSGHRVYFFGDSHDDGLPEHCDNPRNSSGPDFVLRNLYNARNNKVSLTLEHDMLRPENFEVPLMRTERMGLDELHFKLLPCFWPDILELPCPFPNLTATALDIRVGFFDKTTDLGKRAQHMFDFALNVYDLMLETSGSGFGALETARNNSLQLTEHFFAAKSILIHYNFNVKSICAEEEGTCFVNFFANALYNNSMFSTRLAEFVIRLSKLSDSDNTHFSMLWINATTFFQSQLATSSQYIPAVVAALHRFVNAVVNNNRYRICMDNKICTEQWYIELVREFRDNVAVQNVIHFPSDVMDYVVMFQLIWDSIQNTPSIVYAGDYHLRNYAGLLQNNNYELVEQIDATYNYTTNTYCLDLTTTFQSLDLSPGTIVASSICDHGRLRRLCVNCREDPQSLSLPDLSNLSYPQTSSDQGTLEDDWARHYASFVRNSTGSEPQTPNNQPRGQIRYFSEINSDFTSNTDVDTSPISLYRPAKYDNDDAYSTAPPAKRSRPTTDF
jgi:hypothetical protein